MKQKIKVVNLPKIYTVSALITIIVFIATNRGRSYRYSIFYLGAFGVIGSSLFIFGAIKSWRQKDINWLIMNILTIIIIVSVSVWFGLLIYAFRDFTFTIPD